MKITIILPAIALAISLLAIVLGIYNTHRFQRYLSMRQWRKRAGPLPEGYRWLTTSDTWQLGDEYNNSRGQWWRIGFPNETGAKKDFQFQMRLCATPHAD